ncbi:hypothetical protein B0O99DRAFT_99375 [Bisporella sp. PMI_857]|nr:hypothetical protein B0O99DRAFT_99375 [Bisporella sp. PMI_857]
MALHDQIFTTQTTTFLSSSSAMRQTQRPKQSRFYEDLNDLNSPHPLRRLNVSPNGTPRPMDDNKPKRTNSYSKLVGKIKRNLSSRETDNARRMRFQKESGDGVEVKEKAGNALVKEKKPPKVKRILKKVKALRKQASATLEEMSRSSSSTTFAGCSGFGRQDWSGYLDIADDEVVEKEAMFGEEEGYQADVDE